MRACMRACVKNGLSFGRQLADIFFHRCRITIPTLLLTYRRICQRRGAVEIVTRQCETRYCCGSQCTCLGDVHENSNVCSGCVQRVTLSPTIVSIQTSMHFLVQIASSYLRRLSDNCVPVPVDIGCLSVTPINRTCV